MPYGFSESETILILILILEEDIATESYNVS